MRKAVEEGTKRTDPAVEARSDEKSRLERENEIALIDRYKVCCLCRRILAIKPNPRDPGLAQATIRPMPEEGKEGPFSSSGLQGGFSSQCSGRRRAPDVIHDTSSSSIIHSFGISSTRGGGLGLRLSLNSKCRARGKGAGGSWWLFAAAAIDPSRLLAALNRIRSFIHTFLEEAQEARIN
ncbi:hypothetical protein L249_8222, partial [Ophiocordyceps polyrhachis-furcata BCC 54312]